MLRNQRRQIGVNGRQPLPGEHGFRLFPGFYKPVTDAMRRIPCGDHGKTFDKLTVATRILLEKPDKPRSLGS
jgi:hypothetical protein